MIFYWLIVGIRKFIWLFKIPSLQDVARIDKNAPCPICGARAGRIRCTWQTKPGVTARNIKPDVKVVLQHSCGECGARWFDEPIVKVDPTRVMPGVPRDELEAKEDRAAMLQA